MLRVKDIMNTNIATIQGSATVAEALAVMKEKHLRDLVVEPRTPQDAYGILTETDIVYKVAAYGKDPNEVQIHEIMTKPCIVVNSTLTVERVAQLFANYHIHRAPVIKEKLIGVVSITDIIRQTMWWQG